METNFEAKTDKFVLQPVRLRGHHFLCLLTYKGLGYTPAFVQNLTEIVEAINAVRPVVLAYGPDDICKALTQEDRAQCGHDCETASVYWRDEEAVQATAPLIDQPMDAPFTLDLETVERLRQAFAEGTTRAGCARCPWTKTCDGIAEAGFEGTVLFPPGGR